MIPVVLAFVIMTVLVSLFLAPAFFGTVRNEDDEEVATYFAQIDTIRSDKDVHEDEAEAAIAALQKQILAKQETNHGRVKLSRRAGGLTLIALIVMAGATYWDQASRVVLGDEATIDTATIQAPLASMPQRQLDQDTQLRALVAQLEQRLATDRANDPAGWQLYARSLITLGEFDRAIDAYDTALTVSENDLDVAEERRRAIEFIETRRAAASEDTMRGPSEQDMIDAQSMNPEDRQTMILGMVDGLAARLEENPDNPAGWVRLIRARLVLGQIEQASRDITTIRKTYAESPEKLEEIIQASGWQDP